MSDAPLFDVQLFTYREVNTYMDGLEARDGEMDFCERQSAKSMALAIKFMCEHDVPCICCAGAMKREPVYLALLTAPAPIGPGWATGFVCRKCARKGTREVIGKRLQQVARLQFAEPQGRA